MFLMELWTQYLSKTMPVLSPGGVPLVVIQMLAGLPPLAGLYRSVRRDSPWERVMLCMVPGIFIIAFAAVEPLFFDSFLGEGFPWTEALRRFLYQSRFFEETAALALVFLAVSVVSRLAQRRDKGFSLVGFLLSTGVGLAASAAVLAVDIDYFLLDGRLLLALDGQMVKWLVYGIYLLIYQTCVLLVCLLWRLLFSERRDTGNEMDYERWLRRYLSRSWRAYGWSALMFSVLWAFSVVRGLYQEGSPYLWALAVNVGLAALGVGCLVWSMFRPDYRRILSWGDPERTLSRLHRELVEKEPLVKTDIGFLTEHYLVTSMPKRIFCRALLERVSEPNGVGVCTLRFRDGGRCRINMAYRQLLGPLPAEVKKEAHKEK